MKYLMAFTKKRVFSFQEASAIVGNKHSTQSVLYEYTKKGFITRVKKDLYVANDLANKLPIAERYEIASAISDDAVLGLHSAFEVYGFANQVYNVVFVHTDTRFREFTFDEVTYRRIPQSKPSAVNTLNKAKVYSIEHAVIENIDGIGKTTDLEETVRCLQVIPSLNDNKLKEELQLFNKKELYKKAGWIFKTFLHEHKLTNTISFCFEKKSNGISLLDKSTASKRKFDAKWELCYPEYIQPNSLKGVNVDANV